MSEDKKIVLVVDDVPVNIAVLNVMLKDRFKVKVATNGTKALAIAALEPHPDLILLDVIMPEMDGITVYRKLKEDTATATIPVIFTTGADSDEEKESILSLEPAGLLHKPIDSGELNQLIEPILK
jgi:putative two-component system response regulator